MFLDILIRHVPSTIYSTVGRSFYTPQDSKPLPGGAEVWQGFYQSARPGVGKFPCTIFLQCSDDACLICAMLRVGKMYINLDVSATAFHEAGRLPDLVVKYLGRRSIDELRRGISERDNKKLEKQLKGLKIQVTHRGEAKRRYKITKLTPGPVERTMFKDENGQEMSVAAYFTQKYNMRLAYPFLPCIVVKRDVFLPMEVCELVPGQRLQKKLNEKQTADMIKFTCQKPNIRANKINQGLQLLQYRNNPYLQQCGMTVKPEMAVVNARVLATPQISYSNATPDGTFAPQGGAWNLRGKKLAQGAVLGSWSVVNFTSSLPMPAIQRFIRELCQTFIDTGLVSSVFLTRV